MLAVLGSPAELALGSGGILAALRALAHSRALHTNAVGLGATSATGHRASCSHFAIVMEKNARKGNG